MPEPVPTRRAPIPLRTSPPAVASASRSAAPRGSAGTTLALDVKDLRREYGSKVALQNATFQVHRGEIFGFLGPNGAGKTTTIRVLVGLLRPTSGSARILGEVAGPDSPAAKALIGYLPDEPAFPAPLKALPLLKSYGRFYGIGSEASDKRGRELLQFVGLQGQEMVRIKTFSHGMKKRFALAAALLHDPPVLILDEPSSGLDPAGTAWFRDFMRTLRSQGKTVFLSSHVLHEVQQVCDRVGIINGGRILAVDTIDNLGQRVRQRAEIVVVAEGIDGAALTAVRALPGVMGIRQDGDRLRIDAQDPDLASEVNGILVRHGAKVMKVEASTPNLEDIFLALTGGKA